MIFNRLKLAVDRVIAAFSVAVMLALVVCVVWQVFSRYVLNQPSTLTDELARFLMIWVGLLGAAYTVGAQRHLSIDLFALALNKRKQLLLSIVINVLILGFAGICRDANTDGIRIYHSAIKWIGDDVLCLVFY